MKNIKFDRVQHPAFKDGLSFEIKSGEFVTILGDTQNTIIQLIIGHKTPKQGDIYIGDRVVNKLKPLDRDAIYVFGGDDCNFGLEEGSILRRMTVYDNIAKDMRAGKIPESVITDRILDISDALSFKDFLQQRISQLSPMQKLHVALAKSLVNYRALLLMEDILAPLDASEQATARAFLPVFHQKVGRTIIMSCRSVEDARALGARVLVLRDGRIHQFDTPENINV